MDSEQRMILQLQTLSIKTILLQKVTKSIRLEHILWHDPHSGKRA